MAQDYRLGEIVGLRLPQARPPQAGYDLPS